MYVSSNDLRPYPSTLSWGTAVGVLSAAVLLGFVATSRTGIILASLVAAALIGAWGVRRKWGIVVCLAPVFLLPVTEMTSLPATGFLHPRFLLAVVTTILSVSYWQNGAGRPRLNIWSFCAVGTLLIALVALGARSHISVQESFSLPLFAFSGLLVGQCLGRPGVMKAIAIFALPVAALAILEAVGLENVWSVVFHANAHVGIAEGASGDRSTASFGHPLIAGACLMATALVLLSARERFLTLAGVACIVGAITTVSRSALLGGAVGLTVFALQSRGHRTRTLTFLVAIIAVVGGLISAIPAVHHSFETRVLHQSQRTLIQQESVRTNSLAILEDDWNNDPDRLLFGGGVGYSTKLLTARGGNAYGYDIFDNEYITMMYDGGLILMLLIVGLLSVAVARSDRFARKGALPALAAIVVTMYFVDGMDWPSLSVVTWMVIGFLTIPKIGGAEAAQDASGGRINVIERRVELAPGYD